MNSVSVVGLLPRKSKLWKAGPCRCLFPRRRRACWSVGAPLAPAEEEEVVVSLLLVDGVRVYEMG